MITKELKLDISMLKINWLFENEFNIHIKNVPKFKSRLRKNTKYPLKWLLCISTSLDEINFSPEKREELLKTLDDLPDIF